MVNLNLRYLAHPHLRQRSVYFKVLSRTALITTGCPAPLSDVSVWGKLAADPNPPQLQVHRRESDPLGWIRVAGRFSLGSQNSPVRVDYD